MNAVRQGRRWKNKDMLEQWSWMVSCSDNLNAALALELFYFTSPLLQASSSVSVDSGHSSTRSSRAEDPQSSAQERWGCRAAAAPTPQAWKMRSFSSPLNSSLPLGPSPSFPGTVLKTTIAQLVFLSPICCAKQEELLGHFPISQHSACSTTGSQCREVLHQPTPLPFPLETDTHSWCYMDSTQVWDKEKRSLRGSPELENGAE